MVHSYFLLSTASSPANQKLILILDLTISIVDGLLARARDAMYSLAIYSYEISKCIILTPFYNAIILFCIDDV